MLIIFSSFVEPLLRCAHDTGGLTGLNTDDLLLHHVRAGEALTVISKQFTPLIQGDIASIQDQPGNTPRMWSKTGTVLEVLSHDSFLVRVDGSNKVTKRNR